MARADQGTGDDSGEADPVIRTPGFCALCKSRCGSTMVTQGTRLIAQEPLPGHPTGAALCLKGRAAPEIVANAQRELHPLRRTTPKGSADPGWQRISWDEALDTVAERLGAIRTAHGPEAVAFGVTTPSGTPIADDIHWVSRFINAFGSPNLATGTEICNWHKDFAHAYTFGRGIASPDFEHSGCVVFWGHNPSAAWLDHATAALAARRRGAKMIVVDPRRAGFASRADQWLRVRPGADGILALGIAGEMIRHGWFDEGFVRDWSNGPLLVRSDTNRFLRAGDLAELPAGSEPDDLVAWDAGRQSPIPYSMPLRAYRREGSVSLEASVPVAVSAAQRHVVECRTAFALYRSVCEAYTPERVAEVAWVDAAQVTETARLLFEARPVSYYAWAGVGQHTNATQTDRAIATLMALTGSFDAPGGNVEFGKPAMRDVSGREFMSPEQRAKSIGLERSTLGPGRHGWIGSDALYESIVAGRPYKIHAMFGFGRNFLVNHANGQRGADALSRLSFYAHADVTMTPTAAYADVFLPINTPWEREALRIGFEGSQRAEGFVQLRQAAVPSAGESRSDAFVIFELAKRLGFGDLFWDGSIEAGLAAMVEPSGLSLDDLRAKPEGISVAAEPHYHRYRRLGFATQTGKVEFFSEAFRDAGQNPLPEFVEPAASPYRGATGYPLVLTSTKVVHYLHGQHRSVPSLRQRMPDPEVSLHPDTALERGIAHGDWVEVATPNGSARLKASFDADLDPRVVCAQYGWWQANAVLGSPGFDAASDKGANYNRLISDRQTDPISGSTGLRSALCDVRPIKDTSS